MVKKINKPEAQEFTTVRVQKSTHADLCAYGQKNDNMDDIIRRLLENVKQPVAVASE